MLEVDEVVVVDIVPIELDDNEVQTVDDDDNDDRILTMVTLDVIDYSYLDIRQLVDTV